MSTSDIALRPTSALITFAEEASQVHGIAKALAGTSFVPKSMQGRPDEITGAILAGREIGLDPMTALQSIDIIEGRPAIRANTMRGLAMAAGCVFEVVSASDTRVQLRGRGPGQDAWTPVDWTLDRAKKMNLTTKSNWQKMPQAMLMARATSELCRLIAANVLIGMPYSTEELTDSPAEDMPQPAEAPARTRTAQRAPVTATIQNVVPDAPEELQAAFDGARRELEASEGITMNTRKAVMASFNDAGVSSRDARLAQVTRIVGREVASVNQLTEAEGKTVVRELKNLPTEPAEDEQGWPVAAQVAP